jgi:hypothetical protein
MRSLRFIVIEEQIMGPSMSVCLSVASFITLRTVTLDQVSTVALVRISVYNNDLESLNVYVSILLRFWQYKFIAVFAN